MPAPTTSEQFLELVEKSGVVDAVRLQSYVNQLRESGQFPSTADDLAKQLVEDGIITHFQAEQFRIGRWRRFTIGKYKILERLGVGGMGSVYLCEHVHMKRRVAVKVLPPNKINDSSSLERFYREARAVAVLDHPNIVRAYDIDEDNKLHFLVMEHVDGASLQEIIKKTGPMDYLRAAHYARQSALGLQHAHETAGLVHRDIKPANILVDRYGVVKLLDMGLARFFHDDTDDLTKRHDENVLGTADFLAPEQALDSHGADIRADIYSLGGTIYFCLTGRTPFTDGTIAQKLIWHQTRQPKPIRSIRPEVPEGLVAIIDKMMAKDRNARYQTPQEVADALEEWTQTPIPPPPEEEMPQFSLAARSSGPLSDAGMSSASRALRETVSSRRSWQSSSSSSASHRTPSATPHPSSGSASPRPSSAPARPAPRPAPDTVGNVSSAAPTKTDARSPRDVPIPQIKTSPFSIPQLLAKLDWQNRSPAARYSIIAVAVIPVLVLLLWFFLSSGGDDNVSKKREPILVSDEPGQTLEAALRKAVPGDRIRLTKNVTEANLTINKENVVIEADEGVVWKCPEGVPPNTKLLIVQNAPGFALKGVTLDGANQAESLIVVFGSSPGARFENLTCRNAQRFGFLVANAEGSAEAPITFSNVTFQTQPGQIGIFFDLKPSGFTTRHNAHFRIQDCKFEGGGKKVAALNPTVITNGTLHLPPDLTLEPGP